jgi:Rrf2 family protein
MKLSQKVRYGVACLYELSKYPGEFLEADRIAASQKMPPAYSQKILHALAHAGLVFGVKGTGYRLSRSLESITALELMKALSNESESAVAALDVADRFEKKVNAALNSLNLADVAGASFR